MKNFGKNFNLFLAGSSLGAVATTCIRFAVAWHAVQHTGSAVVFAGMIAASSLVEVYCKPFLSPLGDYFNRLLVYRICIGMAAIVALALLGAVVLLPFSAVLLSGLLMVLSLVAGLREPTAAGLVPSLVEPKDLTGAQALRSTVSSSIGLGGSMLGGLIVAVAGVPTALGAAVLLSILGLAGASKIHPAGESPGAPNGTLHTYLRTWHHRTLDGMRAVWLTGAERTTALAAALINIAVVPLTAIIAPVWVAKTLNGTPKLIAAIEAGLAVGVVLGSSFVTGWANDRLGRFATMIIGTALMGCAVFTASLLTSPVEIVACMVVAGAGFTTFAINASTLRAAATPASFRTRLAGGVGFLSCCAYPITSQGFGFVIERSGAAFAVGLCGICILLAAAVQLFNRDARRLLGQETDQIVGAYEALYPSAFADRRQAAHA